MAEEFPKVKKDIEELKKADTGHEKSDSAVVQRMDSLERRFDNTDRRFDRLDDKMDRRAREEARVMDGFAEGIGAICIAAVVLFFSLPVVFGLGVVLGAAIW